MIPQCNFLQPDVDDKNDDYGMIMMTDNDENEEPLAVWQLSLPFVFQASVLLHAPASKKWNFQNYIHHFIVTMNIKMELHLIDAFLESIVCLFAACTQVWSHLVKSLPQRCLEKFTWARMPWTTERRWKEPSSWPPAWDDHWHWPRYPWYPYSELVRSPS